MGEGREGYLDSSLRENLELSDPDAEAILAELCSFIDVAHQHPDVVNVFGHFTFS